MRTSKYNTMHHHVRLHGVQIQLTTSMENDVSGTDTSSNIVVWVEL